MSRKCPEKTGSFFTERLPKVGYARFNCTVEPLMKDDPQNQQSMALEDQVGLSERFIDLNISRWVVRKWSQKRGLRRQVFYQESHYASVKSARE